MEEETKVVDTTVEETETEEQEEMELQAYYKMDANGNLVKVYEKEP